MALVSFGQTIRTAAAGVTFKNITAGGSATNLDIPAYGISQIAPGASETVPFELIDDLTRNPRHSQVNVVNASGAPYLDDFAALAKAISTGKFSVSTATYTASSNTWTTGATSAFTATTDGSVYFA